MNMAEAQKIWDAQVDRHTDEDGSVDIDTFNAESQTNAARLVTQPALQPIETAPRNGTFMLLFGPSGYVSTPLRCHVGCWGTTYKINRWLTHSGDDFTDDGEAPTHWTPLPK